MPRYAAFLRGITPTNCKMTELGSAFEAAGFKDVKTLLASGNVVFDAPKASNASLQAKAEAAMQKRLGKSFLTVVRPVEELQALLASDPYKGLRVSPAAKRIVTFLRQAPAKAPKLPIEQDNARILVLKGGEVFSAYLPTGKGPVFMSLIEKAFGKEQTTRTWQTVEKAAR